MEDIPPEITQYTDESLSTIHHTLRATRRRLLVSLLAYHTLTTPQYSGSSEGAVPVRQLAREIVVLEEDVDLECATGDLYHNVYSSLIQTHLPELDDVAVVEYDADRKEVAPAPNLIAVVIVVATTSPPARLLFHRALTDFDRNDLSMLRDSSTD